MIESIGRHLVERRTDLGLPQRTVAERIGVSWRTLSRWEREVERVPERYVAALTTVLELDEREMPPARGVPWPRAEGRLEGASGAFPGFYRYPVKGSIDQMLDLTPTASRLHKMSRERGLTPADLAAVEVYLPRDSALELILPFHALATQGRIELRTPLELGVRRLVVEKDREVYIGDVPRPVVIHADDRRTLVFIPQTSLVVSSQSRTYRADFLTLYLWHGPLPGKHDRRRLQGCRPGLWLDVAIDSKYHNETADDDARRARGLGLPRLGYRLSHLEEMSFLETLAAEAHRILLQRVAEGRLLPD